MLPLVSVVAGGFGRSDSTMASIGQVNLYDVDWLARAEERAETAVASGVGLSRRFDDERQDVQGL